MLVVDAEPLITWTLRETLTTAGFEVIEMAPDPPFPAVGTVDVLVLDATLPNAGALGILEHVRASNPRCRVLLLTSFDAIGLARLPDRSPHWRTLQKPFDLTAVVAAVRDLAHPQRR